MKMTEKEGLMHTDSRWSALATLVAVLAAVAVVGCAPQETGSEDVSREEVPPIQASQGQELFGRYQRPEPFPQPLPDHLHPHEGWTWGSVAAVFAESSERIWIAQRGELPLPQGADPWTPYSLLNPSRGSAPATTDGIRSTCQETGNLRGYERRWRHVIFVVDSDGNLVDEWPQHDALFGAQPCGRGPHKIKISPYDPEKHVWVIDDQLHVIYKFTQEGELVHTLGELGVRGRGPNNFDRPTDIAWLPDGTYFISDGYGGTRVAKFDADNNFIMDWGGPPADRANPGPNEFNTVHSIAISADRRLYVVDRAHARIQIFDENGNFLDMFSTGPRASSRPYAHEILRDRETGEEFIWVADGGTHRILKYDLDGNYLYGWGRQGGQPGQFNGPHSLTVDPDGNLYTAEVFAGRVQKFVPRPGADPAKLAGHQLREWD